MSKSFLKLTQETGTGSTYESPGIFDHIWIENTVFHECYGALNLRGNANVSTNAIILKNNSWIHISNDYSDTPWPLKVLPFSLILSNS